MWCFPLYAFSAEVKDTVVSQSGNRIEFRYDLIGDEPTAEVTISLTLEGKEYRSHDLHLEGDIGNVKPGKGKRIYWNVLQDFPRGIAEEFGWKIDIVNITIPLQEGKSSRGWLGVYIQPLTADAAENLGISGRRGALVADVTSGGPAEKAGIRSGDVIVGFNGKEIRDEHDLPQTVASTKPGKSVDVKLIRGGKETTIAVKIAEMK